jgi:hypothetical protein
VAFWNLSEKGIEYLDVLDAKHAPAPDIELTVPVASPHADRA